MPPPVRGRLRIPAGRRGRLGVMRMAVPRPVRMMVRRVRRLPLLLLLLPGMLMGVLRRLRLVLGMTVRVLVPPPGGGVGDVPSVVVIVRGRGGGRVVLLLRVLRMPVSRRRRGAADGSRNRTVPPPRAVVGLAAAQART